MEEGNIGKSGELFIVHLVNYDLRFVPILRTAAIKLAGVVLKGNLVASCGSGGCKTDVKIRGLNGGKLGLSVKKAKPTARPDNHLDRRWVNTPGTRYDSWANVLKMPNEIRDIIQSGIINKAHHRNADLIDLSNQAKIRNFFMAHLDAFLEEVFRMGEVDLKIFAVIEYNGKEALYLFSLDDIIQFIKKDIASRGISFGKTIRLGKYIQIQRKAGNGVHIPKTLLKTNPAHPGNQMQTKLMVLSLRDDAISTLKYVKFP